MASWDTDIADVYGSLLPRYPLAQLGKARAMKSKKEYEKFFKMWKDADKDLPALIAAKKEYKKMKWYLGCQIEMFTPTPIWIAI